MNPGIVAVGAAVLAILAVVLAQIRWKPKRKKWCAVFYMVGRLPRTLADWPDENTGKPAGDSLDEKLDQVIEAISSLPCSSYSGTRAEPKWEADVHVVLRALWNDNGTKPLAKVVSWRPFAPKETYFPGEDLDPVTKDLTSDLTHYFAWVYEKCPADHYAVFFWGHSMGPGGLFEVREKPYVPSPGGPLPPPVISASLDLTEFERAFVTLAEARALDAPSSPLVPSYSRLTAADVKDLGEMVEDLSEEGETTGLSPGGPLPVKVDVVLFQDCWMSTLETAFQIQDTVRYVVASQSLVPIGYAADGSLGAVWPYKELIDCALTKSDFSGGMMNILKQFFDGTLPPLPPTPNYNRIPNPTLPFSLLDLGKQRSHVSTVLSLHLQQLVAALSRLDTPGRSGLVQGSPDATVGRLFSLDPASGDLQAGEVALLDVPTLCHYLEDSTLWPPVVKGQLSPPELKAIKDAAAAVRGALATSHIVKSCFESANASAALGFKGISVLWKPSAAPTGDPFLVDQVPGGDYQTLRFALETTVGATASTALAKGWKTYAFELHS